MKRFWKSVVVSLLVVWAAFSAASVGRAQTTLTTDDGPAIAIDASAGDANEGELESDGALLLPDDVGLSEDVATDSNGSTDSNAVGATSTKVLKASPLAAVEVDETNVGDAEYEAAESSATSATTGTAEAETVDESVFAGLSSDSSLRRLVAGNARYLKDDSPAATEYALDADYLGPFATIAYSSDMPVRPDSLTQTTDREVYLTPIESGAVSSDDLAAIEYGVLTLQTPLLVVSGHYPSRDVSELIRKFDLLERKAQRESAKVARTKNLATTQETSKELREYNLVGPAIARAREAYPDLQGYDLANVVSEALVWQSLETILIKSTVVQDLVRAGRLDVVASIVDDQTGRIYWLGQHPMQEEFLKPAPQTATSAATDAEFVLEEELPDALDETAVQACIDRYENNVYYVDVVDEYYVSPIYYAPSWGLFRPNVWRYRPWCGVCVAPFVPWPYYNPWGPPPGVVGGLALSIGAGRLNFFIGFNCVPGRRPYFGPDFRPPAPWWDDFHRPGPVDPIYRSILDGRRDDLRSLPPEERPGFRPGPGSGDPRGPGAPRPIFRPSGPLPGGPGFVGPGGVRDLAPGYRPGAMRPGVDVGARPGAIAPEGRRIIGGGRPGIVPGNGRPLGGGAGLLPERRQVGGGVPAIDAPRGRVAPGTANPDPGLRREPVTHPNGRVGAVPGGRLGVGDRQGVGDRPGFVGGRPGAGGGRPGR